MNTSELRADHDLLWNIAIIGTSAVALVTILAGLLAGISVVLPHLLYIPVVIVSYRYPKRGLFFSACIGIAYLLMVITIMGWNSMATGEAAVRTVVVVAIGGLVAFLTLRLRAQETLYQGLFENSEGGNILIRQQEGTFVIEEINWNAAALLQSSPALLRGNPVTSFWDQKDHDELLSRLAHERKIYASETTFQIPGGGKAEVLLSMATLPEDRAILSFVDITRRVAAEQALHAANEKLHLLSRISSDHLNRTVDKMIETLDQAESQVQAGPFESLIAKVRGLAWNLARQLFLSDSYKDLGTTPPQWIPVQRVLESMQLPKEDRGISIRYWIERLEILADPLFRDVLVHLVDNAIRHGITAKNVVVSYYRVTGGIDIIIEDDGPGIPLEMKEKIFIYDSGGHSGLGLFICRQIIGVTGMTMVENGIPGIGARFVIHVPDGNYRIEGTGEDAPPFPLPSKVEEIGRGAHHQGGTRVREITSPEFPLANTLWIDYHRTTGDPVTDRIFVAFAGEEAVSIARCRRHPDGLEVDGVFTPERHRGHGYANAVVWGLIDATGKDALYMHSVLNLTAFYGQYGFVPIPETELPPTIKERFAWAGGEMEGANVCPMRRNPPDGDR